MARSAIVGTGHHVPERVVRNEDLTRWMDTSDDWIRQRTGIEERRWVSDGESGAALAHRASLRALAKASLSASDVDAIILATLSPDHFFPGTGVFLGKELGLEGVPALDIRNQCTGFVYGLSIADAWIRVGQYSTVLLVGVEIHSTGLDLSNRGRDIAVLFGDGAGAVVLQGTEEEERGVLSTHLHADGRHAKMLWCDAGASLRHPRISEEDLRLGRHYPRMEGKEVFKQAVALMPEAVLEALAAHGYGPQEIDLLVPHQANLRISQMVQKRLGLPDQKVMNNIQRYGNTTAASIPIALAEAVEAGRLSSGDLVCLAAFGSGLTWASALIRW